MQSGLTCRALGRIGLLLAMLSVLCGAGSIFDSDWTPPKPATRPAAAVPGALPATSPASPQATPSAPPQPSRLAIPAKLAQAGSRENLADVFAAELKDASPAGRRKLAGSLIDMLARTTQNPADQYVLLIGAINAAKEGSDLKQCGTAADLLGQIFDVDAFPLKVDAALTMNLAASKSEIPGNVRASLDLLDPLIAAEDLGVAARICQKVKPLPVDATLSALVARRIKDLDTLRVEYERVAPHQATLKTKPDDPTANLAVGHYYCLVRDEWDKGVAYLAKGSDADLKKAAVDELQGANTASTNELLGDGWWAVGEKQSESIRPKVRAHAVQFYEKAIQGSSGLARVKMEHRIAEASPKGPAVAGGQAAGEGAAARGVGMAPQQIVPGAAQKATTGTFYIIFKGNFEVLHNGRQLLPKATARNTVYEYALTVNEGDKLVLRLNSRFVYRSVRYAFIDSAGQVVFESNTQSAVLVDVSAGKPGMRVMAGVGSSDATQAQAWVSQRLPATAQSIGLPSKTRNYELTILPAAIPPGQPVRTP